jgi:hypothetical protein
MAGLTNCILVIGKCGMGNMTMKNKIKLYVGIPLKDVIFKQKSSA